MGFALYGTDFHGKTRALRHCFRLAGRMGVRAIILGGDLTPKTYALKFKSGTLIPSQLIDPDEAPRKVGIRLMEAAKLQRQKLQLEDGSFIFEVDPEISIQRLSEELFLVYKLKNLNKGENTFTPDEIQKIEHFLLPKLKEIELSPSWK